MQNVSFKRNALPEISRTDVGFILVSEGRVNDSKEQVKAADAVMQLFERFSWLKGLISCSSYLAVDGKHILYYLQWEDEASHERFVQGYLPGGNGKINEPFLTLQHKIEKLTLYRHAVLDASEVPGCIVIMWREYESLVITKKSINAAYDAVKAEEQMISCISANFHISLNGLAMVNYAEWPSEHAYRHFVEESMHGTFIGISPLWEKVREFPYQPSYTSFKVYKFYRSIVKDKLMT